MRRLLVVIVAASVLVAAASAFAFTEEQHDSPWALLGASADGRSLRVGYIGGGCSLSDGRPIVSEFKHRVVVRVRQTGRVPGEGEGCTAEMLLPQVSVPLSAPLNGRGVEGGPRSQQIYGQFPPVVPRVVGLDRRDAIAALRSQGFQAKTIGRVRRGTVVRQRPRPGVVVPRPGAKPPLVGLRAR
jgi:hypothetical protein